MKSLHLVFILLSLFVAEPAIAGHDHPEKFYQEKWCAEHSGKSEVLLPDNTRADCITSTHAIEFDFAGKWYEALGQSLYYGLQTGKQPGVVLIIETPAERKFLLRLNSTIDHYKLPIDTWSVGSAK